MGGLELRRRSPLFGRKHQRHWTWTNNYNAGVGLNLNAAPFRDRVTRGGPGVLGNQSRSIWFYANTDQRRALSFSYNGYYEADRFNTARRNVNPSVNLRPTSAMSLSAGFRYEINNDDAQWVANDELETATHYVFGRIEQKTVAMTLRFNYTMTPNLSLQTYAEPFVSAGDYTNFRELVDGRAAAYADRYAPYAYTGDADFNIRSFRTTNVLRWEYKPGSQLFVVWQQGRFEKITTTAPSSSTATSAACSARLEERLPGEVDLLVEHVRRERTGDRRTESFLPPASCLHYHQPMSLGQHPRLRSRHRLWPLRA